MVYAEDLNRGSYLIQNFSGAFPDRPTTGRSPREPRHRDDAITFTEHAALMSRVTTREVAEAEELLAEVATWSDEEIAALPKLYREKAYEYRRLANSGEG